MSLFKSMEISASGLHAQRGVLEAVSMNLANAHTTRTDEGGPYVRRQAVLTPSPLAAKFPDIFTGLLDQANQGVKAEIQLDDSKEPVTLYDPHHPDADEMGYVALPNVNVLEEMIQMMAAVRSYEANVTAFNAAKSMALKSLEIGK